MLKMWLNQSKNKIQGNDNSDSLNMTLKDRFADDKNDTKENEQIKTQVIYRQLSYCPSQIHISCLPSMLQFLELWIDSTYELSQNLLTDSIYELRKVNITTKSKQMDHDLANTTRISGWYMKPGRRKAFEPQLSKTKSTHY